MVFFKIYFVPEGDARRKHAEVLSFSKKVYINGTPPPGKKYKNDSFFIRGIQLRELRKGW